MSNTVGYICKFFDSEDDTVEKSEEVTEEDSNSILDSIFEGAAFQCGIESP